jgi:hypothetical protein
VEAPELSAFVEHLVGESLPRELFDRMPGDVSSSGDASFIWCMRCSELQADYGWLPQARDQDDEHADVACVDLIIDFNSRCELVRADFESHSLAETFALLGDLESAAEMSTVLGKHAEAACPALAALVAGLFVDRVTQ